MKHYQKILDEISSILEENSRGLELSEISHQINVNRNTVSKYLDVLLAQGKAEMKRFGPAKVFYCASGIPMSSLIDLSSDHIFILNQNFDIVMLNQPAKRSATTTYQASAQAGDRMGGVLTFTRCSRQMSAQTTAGSAQTETRANASALFSNQRSSRRLSSTFSMATMLTACSSVQASIEAQTRLWR